MKPGITRQRILITALLFMLVGCTVQVAPGESETQTWESVSEQTEEPPLTAEPAPLIVIDPGHQKQASAQLEPIGPGAKDMKARVSSGTQGVHTGLAEYELTLELSLQLEQELVRRGYRVLLTRRTHEVDLSNMERALLANDAGADVFLRIHANGSEDPEKTGLLTICQTAKDPYGSGQYVKSRRLAEDILAAMEKTTAASGKVWETDSMSGINWARVPVTIIEVGYMSNPEEDRSLSEEAYRNQLVQGMADGIAAYLKAEPEN